MVATAGLAALWCVAMALQGLAAETLRGLHRLGAAAVFGGAITSLVTASTLAAILVLRGHSRLEEIIVVSLSAGLLSFALAAAAIGRTIGVTGGIDHVPARLLLVGSTAMLISSIGHTGAAQADLWIVGALSPESDVALYGAAKRLMRLVSLPIMIVTLVVPPVIADLYHRGERQRLQRVVRGAATLAGVPALLLLLVFAFGSSLILTLVYGEFYAAASWVLILLSIERILFVWAGPAGMMLLMTGHERDMMAVTLVAGLIEVIATFIGARWGGYEGAAVGFLIGSGLRSIATWNQARRVTGLRTDVNPFGLREAIDPLRRILVRRKATSERADGPPDA